MLCRDGDVAVGRVYLGGVDFVSAAGGVVSG